MASRHACFASYNHHCATTRSSPAVLSRRPRRAAALRLAEQACEFEQERASGHRHARDSPIAGGAVVRRACSFAACRRSGKQAGACSAGGAVAAEAPLITPPLERTQKREATRVALLLCRSSSREQADRSSSRFVAKRSHESQTAGSHRRQSSDDLCGCALSEARADDSPTGSSYRSQVVIPCGGGGPDRSEIIRWRCRVTKPLRRRTAGETHLLDVGVAAYCEPL